MNIPLLTTALGPLAGGAGWILSISWLFWLGVGVCALTLVLDMGSGVMKLPILPALFMIVGALSASSWSRGAGIGLVVWTALEAVGMLYARARHLRNRP